MQSDLNQIRQYLEESNLKDRFIGKLGWDNYTQTLRVIVDETEYELNAIAEKHEVVVFECSKRQIPDYATRRKIQRRVAKTAHENLIIYTDTYKTTEIWQWVERVHGKPDVCREHRYNRDEHSGESLIQKLQNIALYS